MPTEHFTPAHPFKTFLLRLHLEAAPLRSPQMEAGTPYLKQQRKNRKTMSAFIVSKTHIDHLVAIAQHGPRDCEPGRWFPPQLHSQRLDLIDPNDLGQLLLDENIARAIDDGE